MSDNGFWRKSEVQNGKNLHCFLRFSKVFKFSFIREKSNRNSLMWYILKSERTFGIFEIFGKSIMAKRNVPKIHAYMKSVKKIEIFFSALTPSFNSRSSHATPMDLCAKIWPKKVSKRPLSSVLKWAFSLHVWAIKFGQTLAPIMRLRKNYISQSLYPRLEKIELQVVFVILPSRILLDS